MMFKTQKIPIEGVFTDSDKVIKISGIIIHAEVVTHVASSLRAGGLPGYPEVLFVEINVMKSCQSFVALYLTRITKDTRS
jgi:hypothetical protein